LVRAAVLISPETLRRWNARTEQELFDQLFARIEARLCASPSLALDKEPMRHFRKRLTLLHENTIDGSEGRRLCPL
jgi:hypothetical protein